jgi:outer membrane lipoprotein-sorting protein
VSRPAATRGLALAAALAVWSAACATAPLRLPSGPFTPLADPGPIVNEAFGHCDGIQTLTAALALSGRAGRQRLRGRVHAGFERPDAVRLEGVAPFGPPVFILAARGSESTLLLPRDDRVLRDAPPASIIAALAGVDVSPGDLRSLLAGCPGATTEVTEAKSFGPDWVSLTLSDGSTAWLRRTASGWRLVAGTRGPLSYEMTEYAGRTPGRVRLRTDPHAAPASPIVDLTVRPSQVETNVSLPGDAFTVDVPPQAVGITLDELRESGPLRGAARN